MLDSSTLVEMGEWASKQISLWYAVALKILGGTQIQNLIWTGVCGSRLETPACLRVILTEKGTHFEGFFLKYKPIFHNLQVFVMRTP